MASAYLMFRKFSPESLTSKLLAKACSNSNNSNNHWLLMTASDSFPTLASALRHIDRNAKLNTIRFKTIPKIQRAN